ncbi:intracellular exo-alpha-L-arabinofuranosidase 2 [Clostridia bacterium]|nr:intracellular exo-alpha-L-arabinofuranosidase 2 [Clostridia bacterium]
MRKLTISPANEGGTINKNIFGHFAEHLGRCIYDGLYVGENSKIPNINGVRTDIIEALKNIKVPVLRWPGGCFAEEYHWKDGIGPKDKRKPMRNNAWSGVEDNSFGTHEFMDLCERIGCEPYLCGNISSGTVREMSEWVEYVSYDGDTPMTRLRAENGRKEPWELKYFAVGNENWGCGGNMRGEFYVDEYRRFSTHIHNYINNKDNFKYGDNKLFKVACGFNNEWTEILMKHAMKLLDGISIHYYTLPTGDWNKMGSATGFPEEEYYSALRGAVVWDDTITQHSRIMDVYDPDKRVALVIDEWGVWCDPEPGTLLNFHFQQNSMRDAIAAAAILNIFMKHCDRVKMANIAQLINVLQSPILTEGEKMILTPTYHVFDLYKCHQDATLIDSGIESIDINGVPDLQVCTSKDSGGVIHATLVNLSAKESAQVVLPSDITANKSVSARILTAKFDAYNDFTDADRVVIKSFDGFTSTENGVEFNIPACAVMEITVK